MAQVQTVYDMTVREVARRLDVPPETVRRWARDEVVPARKNISGFWRFNRADIDGVQVAAVIERTTP